MGMFDKFWMSWKCKECGYSTPKLEFQTKSLCQCLDDYKIGDHVRLPSYGIKATDFSFEIHGDNVHECVDGWNWFWIEGEALVLKDIITYARIKKVEKTAVTLLRKEGTQMRFINKDRNMTCWYDTREKTGGWSSFGAVDK
jgi:hypothetical protein